MLAGETPAGTVLGSAGVAIRPQADIRNFEDVGSIDSSFETTLNERLAVWAKRFIIELNVHLVIVGLLDFA
jgi:hypothetical protein